MSIFQYPMKQKLEWYRASLALFFTTLTGYIPFHSIRLFLYRYAFGIKVGKWSTLHWRCRFFKPWGIEIGDNTIIGNDAFLDGRRGIKIGNCVITGGEIAIYTLQHNIDDPDFGLEGGEVVIEDYVYLGTRSIVLPTVRIGIGAVVMAGAVVTKDVPNFAVVGGIPAKFVRMRSKNLRYKPKFAKPFQ